MTDIMKLATDYAQACYNLANPDSYDAERAEEARAALQSAIEALQKEVSTLDVLLEECKMDWSGDVTQIKAEHKHEIEALQAEVERLDKENTDSLVSLATAIQHRDGFRKQLDYLRHEMDDLEEDYSNLQSKLDAMGNGEPVGFVAPHELKDLSEGFPATVVMFRSNKRTVPLYAAPKALAPLTRKQVSDLDEEGVFLGNIYEITKAIEAAHGIGGTP